MKKLLIAVCVVVLSCGILAVSAFAYPVTTTVDFYDPDGNLQFSLSVTGEDTMDGTSYIDPPVLSLELRDAETYLYAYVLSVSDESDEFTVIIHPDTEIYIDGEWPRISPGESVNLVPGGSYRAITIPVSTSAADFASVFARFFQAIVDFFGRLVQYVDDFFDGLFAESNVAADLRGFFTLLMDIWNAMPPFYTSTLVILFTLAIFVAMGVFGAL